MEATRTNPTADEILSAPCGTEFEIDGMTLIVNRRVGLSCIGGKAVQVTLTSDGRARLDGWHTGPEAEWVYTERWNAAGRQFHGWLDSVSRQLTQAG